MGENKTANNKSTSNNKNTTTNKNKDGNSTSTLVDQHKSQKQKGKTARYIRREY